MERIRKLIRKYRCAWVLYYGILYLLWFWVLEKSVTKATGFHVMHTRFDDMIPFCEYFIVPYFLWFFYIFGGVLYFLFVNRSDFYHVTAFLYSGMILSLVICTIYPNGTDLRPALMPHKNIFTDWVAWLYRTDTCTNVFPSVHVYNSIAMHIAIMKSKDIAGLKHGALIRRGSFLLALLICLATLFLKQHSLLDVSASCILASIVYGFIYGYPVFEEDGVPDGELAAERELSKRRLRLISKRRES